MMPHRPHFAWIVLGVPFLALLAGAGIRATPSVLMVPLEEEFGWTRRGPGAAGGTPSGAPGRRLRRAVARAGRADGGPGVTHQHAAEPAMLRHVDDLLL